MGREVLPCRDRQCISLRRFGRLHRGGGLQLRFNCAQPLAVAAIAAGIPVDSTAPRADVRRERPAAADCQVVVDAVKMEAAFYASAILLVKRRRRLLHEELVFRRTIRRLLAA